MRNEAVDKILKQGTTGLPQNTSLREFLKQAGISTAMPAGDLPEGFLTKDLGSIPLTKEAVIKAAKEFFKKHGRFPRLPTEEEMAREDREAEQTSQLGGPKKITETVTDPEGPVL